MTSIRYVIMLLNLLLGNALIIHVMNNINNINNNTKNNTNIFNMSEIIEKYLKANTTNNRFEASISLSL